MIVIIEIVNVMLTEKLCMLKMTAIKKISLTGGRDLKPVNRQNALQQKKAEQKREVWSNYQIQLSFIVLFTTKKRLEERQIQGQQTSLIYFFKSNRISVTIKSIASKICVSVNRYWVFIGKSGIGKKNSAHKWHPYLNVKIKNER